MDLIELLVYGFMFGAFLLFNYVSQKAGRRRREQQRQAQEAFEAQQAYVQDAIVPTVDPLGQEWGRAPEALPLEVAPDYREAAETSFRSAPEPVAVPGLVPVSAPRQALAAPARAGPNRPRRRFLRNRQDLRDAVVGMTILGPCRALQPYDIDGTSGIGSGGQAPPR